MQHPKKQFRNDEATDLINTGLEKIRKRSHELNRHLERTVRKIERITTPAPPQELDAHG